MVWKTAAGVIVAGTMLAGCAPRPADTPKASVAAQPMDEGAVSNLEQSWRQAHPGSLIGHVNAVAPDRHILSVTGLPLDQIHEGDIVTILPDGQANNVISAKVYSKENGFAQLEYSGGAEPRQGDLAIWYAAGVSDEASTAAGTNAAAPTTQPGAAVPEVPTPAPTTPTPAPTPAPTAPPETTPPPPTTPAPTTPTTPPAPAPAPGNGTPTPPPTPPADNKFPSDLNK